jgi:hypothetical protein
MLLKGYQDNIRLNNSLDRLKHGMSQLRSLLKAI